MEIETAEIETADEGTTVFKCSFIFYFILFFSFLERWDKYMASKIEMVKKDTQWKISFLPISHSCPPPFSFPQDAAVNSFLRILPEIICPYESMRIFSTPSTETQTFFKYSDSIFCNLLLRLTLYLGSHSTSVHTDLFCSFQWLHRSPLYACVLIFFNQSQISEHAGWFLSFAVSNNAAVTFLV